jgi:DNA repair exonuclease SbcCD nuclease subunit
MATYRFIAWADTHWDKLGARCVTIEDTEMIEKYLFQKAKKEGFDFTLFAGDRYLKREPLDEVKVRADKVILSEEYIIPHYHLIGNHDYVDNSMKWHTSESLRDVDNFFIMDKPSTFEHGDVLIHSLPADHVFDINNYRIDLNKFNLFVFHDAVTGCFLDEAKTQAYDSGIPLETIDLPEFNLVLAGDIHVRQDLPFKNTQGGYLGSVLQRTKADSDAERGWTEYTVTNENGKWEFSREFFPVRSFFTRHEIVVNSETTIEYLQLPVEKFNDQLVEIRIKGSKADVDRIADSEYWKDLETKSNSRRVEVMRLYEAVQKINVVDFSQSNNLIDDLHLYLDSGFVNLGNLSREKIIEKVMKFKEGFYA